MELLDNLVVLSDEEPRETGDIDQFNPKLIPLQRNSYLGQFVAQSESLYSYSFMKYNFWIKQLHFLSHRILNRLWDGPHQEG